MAVKDANLEITEEKAPRVGVWIGSGIGGMETYEQPIFRHSKSAALVVLVHSSYR